MTMEISELTELASEGGAPLTTTPLVGTPTRSCTPVLTPSAEPVRDGEIRVTILGSGDPFVKRSQASASLLIEVGNAERDLFFFDLGSGALANYNGLRLPVTATTKVFLTHLHADHVGDMPTLVWSLAKAGRRDPVEVWGPAGETPDLGTRAYTQHLEAAHAWDMQSLCGHPGQSGARTETTEVPWDRTATVYDRNGVRVSSFPVIHILNGSVGYRLDYNGRSVVFSGDTRPCHPLVDACDGADLLIHETFPSAAGVRAEGRRPLGSPNRSSTAPTPVRPWPARCSRAPGRGCRRCGTSPSTTRSSAGLRRHAHPVRRSGHHRPGPHHVRHQRRCHHHATVDHRPRRLARPRSDERDRTAPVARARATGVVGRSAPDGLSSPTQPVSRAPRLCAVAGRGDRAVWGAVSQGRHERWWVSSRGGVFDGERWVACVVSV